MLDKIALIIQCFKAFTLSPDIPLENITPQIVNGRNQIMYTMKVNIPYDTIPGIITTDSTKKEIEFMSMNILNQLPENKIIISISKTDSTKTMEEKAYYYGKINDNYIQFEYSLIITYTQDPIEENTYIQNTTEENFILNIEENNIIYTISKIQDKTTGVETYKIMPEHDNLYALISTINEKLNHL